MKLSLKNKRGMVYVRGGRFLRVIKTHVVEIGTESVNEKTDRPRVDQAAKPGDLAIEIVKARRNEDLVGYAYLSGDAIRLHSYDAKPEWFRPAVAARIEIAAPKTRGDVNALLGKIIRVKHLCDAGVFSHRPAPSEGSLDTIAEWFKVAFSYEAVGDDAPTPTGHLFGQVMRKKEGIQFHFQPPGQTDELGASQFQIGLVLKTKHLISIDEVGDLEKK